MGEAQSKAHWQADEDAPMCNDCQVAFSLRVRRHHCRNCGYIFCGDCCHAMCSIPQRDMHAPVRVCRSCYAVLGGARRRRATQQQQGASAGAAAVTARDKKASSSSDGVAAAGASAASSSSRSAAATTTATAQTARAASPPSPQHVAAYDDVYSAAWDGADGHATTTTTTTTAAAAADTSVLADAPSSVSSSQQQQQHAMEVAWSGAEGDVAHAYDESERLAQRWAAVRQVMRLDDVLLQRVECVEVDTAVEYCREVEQVTLQPELPHGELCRLLFALPPADGSGGVACLLAQSPAATARTSDTPLLQLLSTASAAAGDDAARVRALLREAAQRTLCCAPATASCGGVCAGDEHARARVARYTCS